MPCGTALLVHPEGDVVVARASARGTRIDVLKALARGTRAVLVGHPWMYGFGAAGDCGVTEVLRLFEQGLRHDLALMARSPLDELQPADVRVAPWWSGFGT